MKGNQEILWIAVLMVVFGIILITLGNSFFANAKCYVNHQEVPCKVFWSTYGWFLAVPFTLIGAVCLIKPELLIKLQVWQWKMLGSKWKPGKLIPKIYRAFRAIFLEIGIYTLYLTLSS